MAHKMTLEQKDELTNAANVKIGVRNGTIIEKGVVLQEDFLVRNEENLRSLFQFFTAYPDLFLDLITPEEDSFHLFFYQRIVLRVLMRFKEVYITAPRAFSKSFLTILAMILQCIFIPGHKDFICAPHANQSARIAKEKIIEIYTHWPLIKREVVGWEIKDNPGAFGKDYTTLRFLNESQFDVVGTTDSTRGGRRNSGLIDEVRRLVADSKALELLETLFIKTISSKVFSIEKKCSTTIPKGSRAKRLEVGATYMVMI